LQFSVAAISSRLVSGPFAREKLYEALDFFSRNVKYAGKVKLFKLLFYLDLMMFRRTGKTVTGLKYEAWPMGPVPADLDREFSEPSSEFRQRFDVTESKRVEYSALVTIDTPAESLGAAARAVSYIPTSIKCRRPGPARYLTKREQQIAAYLAEVFLNAKAEEMSDISHNKSGPWMKARTKGKKQGIDRPVVDLMEGVVAVGNHAEELPPEELRELVEERKRLHQALN
jgi:uncharacterized phage-associated protein